jgi:hypothetical protein
MFYLMNTVTKTFTEYKTLEGIAERFKHESPLADKSYFKVISGPEDGHITVEWICTFYKDTPTFGAN